MGKYQCSVVVIQYNPIWEKLKRTLDSILGQKDCEFEIVIADDGSKENLREQLIDYFDQWKFKDYSLVLNESNAGTVKNIISGIEASEGKYVRAIAPGDLLYSEYTLSHIVAFMEQYQAKEVFGKMAFYTLNDGNVEIVKKQVPFDTTPYQSNDVKRIKEHLLMLGDNISGASYTWEREYYLECLKRVEGSVIYLEDCVSLCTIYDGYPIHFMDEYVTWYEHGTGISTSKSNRWAGILAKDWIAFYEKMLERYPRDRQLRKAKAYYTLSLKGIFCNKVWKNILYAKRYFYSHLINNKISCAYYSAIKKEELLQYDKL